MLPPLSHRNVSLCSTPSRRDPERRWDSSPHAPSCLPGGAPRPPPRGLPPGTPSRQQHVGSALTASWHSGDEHPRYQGSGCPFRPLRPTVINPVPLGDAIHTESTNAETTLGTVLATGPLWLRPQSISHTPGSARTESSPEPRRTGALAVLLVVRT